MTTTMLAYQVGMNAFESKDYKTAVERFTEILAVEPSNAHVREFLARAHFHRAALGPAEAEARILLESDPTDEFALLLLARSLERQSKHDEAAPVRRLLAAVTGDDSHAAGHKGGAS